MGPGLGCRAMRQDFSVYSSIFCSLVSATCVATCILHYRGEILMCLFPYPDGEVVGRRDLAVVHLDLL